MSYILACVIYLLTTTMCPISLQQMQVRQIEEKMPNDYMHKATQIVNILKCLDFNSFNSNVIDNIRRAWRYRRGNQNPYIRISCFVCKWWHRLLDKGIMYLQFTYQTYIHPDDIYERGNPLDKDRSAVCSSRIST
jgi:hypothetical protein